ncbi:MAG: cysteine-rich small domain-containing protein [Clostridiales bacterium]|nr:cysteine-rich small domain-containing protein [Clostridiales bacterium]
MDRHYAFFQHTACEFFPCHTGADPENFNCLFCYCPLYALGEKCGGDFVLLDNGIKDCSHCLFPHKKENYDLITERLKELY